MPFFTQKIPPNDQPFNHIDNDSDLSRVAPQNYISAKNVTFITDEGQTQNSIQITRGNKAYITIPKTVSQNKIYRVTGYGANNKVTGNIKVNVGSQANTVLLYEGASLGATVNNIRTALGGQFVVTAILPDSSSCDIEFIGFGSVEYTITLTIDSNSDIQDLEQQIIQESISTDAAGSNLMLNSFDLDGDLFIWSTAQNNLVTRVATIQGVSGSQITVGVHKFKAGQRIKITDSDLSAINGVWTITSITTTTIVIGYCNNTGTTTTGTIYTYLDSASELGVAQYNPNTDSFVYSRLIRTKQWDFRTQHQIQSPQIEKTIDRISFYWDDDFNPDRAVYYKGEITDVPDSLLTINNPNNEYDLNTIGEETELALSNIPAQLSFVSQNVSGGNVLSGNWRYAFRFVTAELTTTAPSGLTNPINVYSANQSGDPLLIIGDDAGINTSKSNVLLLSNITPGLFVFVDLIAVNYAGTAVSAIVVKRQTLSGATNETLTHTGFETDTTPFDLGELNQLEPLYKISRSMCIVDSHLIRSNLQGVSDPDLSAWAKQIKFKPSAKSISPTTGRLTNLQAGEYQLPVNVNQFMGYMINEVYRFSIKLRYKNTNSWTLNYFISDVIFDTDFTDQRLGDIQPVTATSQCYGKLDNCSLTDAAASEIYPRYLEIKNIDFDFVLPDGNKIRDVFDGFAIERAEVIPEVLCTGIIRVAWKKTSTAENRFPFTEDVSFSQYTPISGGFYTADYKINNYVGLLYSPDIFLGRLNLPTNKDLMIINSGTPTVYDIMSFGDNLSGAANNPYGAYIGLSGDFGVKDNDSQLLTSANVGFVNTGGSIDLPLAKIRMSFPVVFTAWGSHVRTTDTFGGYAIAVKTDWFQNYSNNPDYGFYYVQIRSAIQNKYGEPTNTKYITCGFEQEITKDLTTNSTFDIWGGDTFIQKTILHCDYDSESPPQPGNKIGGGISFYSQNRINSQMQFKTETGNDLFPANVPGATIQDKLKAWLGIGYTHIDQLNYQHGYDIQNNIQIHTSFNKLLQGSGDAPARNIWSPTKPQGSIADAYRTNLPLDFRDLDLSQGEISHIANFNGELHTWQTSAFMKQFFRARATLSGNSDAEVLLGDGKVMDRSGVVVSNYGTDKEFGIVFGLTAGGDSVAYWIDVYNFNVIRFGADGIKEISFFANMASFFKNNLQWVQNVNTPAHGEGIHGVWNQARKEAIWTIRGHRQAEEWISNGNYDIDTVVSYTPTTYSTYSRTGELYKSLSINNSNNNPETSTGKWELIPHTDNNYYNEYTIIYNEIKNGFTVFNSCLPKIYAQWKNTYFSQRPFEIGSDTVLYMHDKGNYATWYDSLGFDNVIDPPAPQTADGYLQFIFNKDENISKEFTALMFNSEKVPYKVDIETRPNIQGVPTIQKTFLVESDWEFNITQFIAGIKNDTVSAPNGTNEEDTSRPFGQWVKIKMYFKAGEFQKLNQPVLKYFSVGRSYNK